MDNKDLEFIKSHSRNYGPGHWPDVFPLDFGMDFHLETKPELYPEINYSWRGNGERCVVLDISTFRDICVEAIHWYGKLRADGINIIREEVDKDGKTNKYSTSGYICEEYKNMENKEHYDSHYDLEITRPVTKEDVEKYPERFEEDFIGWPTNAFYSVDEIIKVAKKVAALRFPGWKFIVKD